MSTADANYVIPNRFSSEESAVLRAPPQAA